MAKILVVDDARYSIMMLEFDLQEAGYDVTGVDNGKAALELLNQHHFDLVLLDVHMPGVSGLEILERIRQAPQTRNLPVIMLSSSENENQIVSALDIGADDYVAKPYIAKVLLARIRNALRLKEKTQELERMVSIDFLTGLTNRRMFADSVKRALAKNKRDKQQLVLAMLDIDHFKKINDSYGHAAGDEALKAFARLLEEQFRSYDMVARLGGEEFAVFMPDTGLEDGARVCERCREATEEMVVDTDGKRIQFTVSIGVASASEGEPDYDTVMKLADQALYQAKNDGRNKIAVHQK